MLPSEALKALATTQGLALLIDRRGPWSGRGDSVALAVEAVIDLPGHSATAYLVRSNEPAGLPSELLHNGTVAYVRLMDRFYVPVVRNAGVVSALFDLIADLYDGLVGYTTNLETARYLLSAVLQGAAAAITILDFGCGTGIAHQALMELNVDATIVGTDISAEMLRHAVGRGEAVMTINRWRTDTRLYDGAIASFVLHYGVSDQDMKRIAIGLKPGARFAANFFKAEPSELARLIFVLEGEGLRLLRQDQVPSTTDSANPALIFERVSS